MSLAILVLGLLNVYFIHSSLALPPSTLPLSTPATQAIILVALSTISVFSSEISR